MIEHSATAFFRTAARAKDFDYHTARHYLAETAFTQRHDHRRYDDISQAQAHADRIAKDEGVPSPRVMQRRGGPGSVYWHSGSYGDSGPEIGLRDDHMHEAALIHEMTHHLRHVNGQPEGHGPDFSRDYGLALWEHHSRPDAARAEFKHYYGAADELMRANPDKYPAPPEDSNDDRTRTAGRADHAGDDVSRGRGGDPAPRGNAGRPQADQPERPARQGRRVHAAAEVERHPELQGDLDRLGGGARHVQDTIHALQHDQGGVSTYPLSHPLDGWHAAITPGGHQVVHRTDPDTKALHVGYAGHNIADAEERLGGSSESGSLPVEFHKGAEKDFDNLHPEVQEKALNAIDRLARGEQHKYDHALTGKHWETGGWRSARADFLHRVTHRFEDHDGNPTSHERAARLFIGHIGPHNYEAAQKRLSRLTFTRGEEQLIQRQAAAVNNDDGVMVALVPPHEVAEQLALQDGQPVDDLHITMAYLGNAADYTREQLKLLPQVVGAWAVRHRPVSVRIGGIGKFNNAFKGQHVLWAAADIPGGAQMHADLARYLEGHGYRLPSEHGWTPHMTLRYVDKHFRFMPHLEEHRWEASEVVTYIRGQRHPARFGGRPSTPTTL